MTGTIVRKKDNGFGFIKPDQEGESDVFFHAQSLVEIAFDDLQEGDKVSFDVEAGREGRPAAVNVQRVETASPTEEETEG